MIKTTFALAFAAAVCTSAMAAGQDSRPAPSAAVVSATVQPGDDFFSYVNGDWVARTEIPADRAAWGATSVMADEVNARVLKLIEGVAANPKASAEEKKVAAFYSSYMNEAAIEAKGAAPLQAMLAKIAAIKDKAALQQAIGASLRADVDPLNATNFFTENLFGIWVAQGLTEPNRNTAYVLQGGLGMPDRAYYLTDSPKMADLRAKYQQHIAAMFTLAGISEADARAARVMALEMAIAKAHASREDSADVQKANNPWTLQDFASKAPGIAWPAFFKAAGLGDQNKFIVWHPGAVTGAAALVASADLASWKDFLAFHTINHAAPTLSKAFVDQRFAFYGKALSGTPEQLARSKRALAATSGALGEPVGHMYVDKYFPAEHKAKVRQMTENIIAAFSKRIDKLDWMAPATRAQAHAKLKSLYVGIGYPDKWHSYAALQVVQGDAFGNAQRAEAFRTATQFAKLHQKVDHTEWAMTPQTVNAVNMPMQNAINIPAGYLQAPFFDPAASDAQNYGAIGTTIGHEVSHSFDDQGAQFDAQGRLRDWWTAEDLAHFKAASSKLVAQYSAYKPFPDLAVNGTLTLSENLADLAGMGAAYDAYRAATGDKANAASDRDFFIGNALKNRNKLREPALRQRILSDGHSPSQYRAATARNLDAWYQAFDVKPGQSLYLAPADRVRVW
jgi:putative endopeptidase